MPFVYELEVEVLDGGRTLKPKGRFFEVEGRNYLAQDTGRTTNVYPLNGARFSPTNDNRLFIEPGTFEPSHKPTLNRLVKEFGMSPV